jgi:hypothetical protein
MGKRTTWVRHGSRDQKSLKKGEIIRRHIRMNKYEYGKALGGFGMSCSTVGGAIFVGPARVKGSIKEKERWHRDHDRIERKTSRRKSRRNK